MAILQWLARRIDNPPRLILSEENRRRGCAKRERYPSSRSTPRSKTAFVATLIDETDAHQQRRPLRPQHDPDAVDSLRQSAR
jgi:hypothetical protein